MNTCMPKSPATWKAKARQDFKVMGRLGNLARPYLKKQIKRKVLATEFTAPCSIPSTGKKGEVHYNVGTQVCNYLKM